MIIQKSTFILLKILEISTFILLEVGVSVGDMFVYLTTTGNASNSCESDSMNEVDKRMEITLNILFSKQILTNLHK